MTRSYPRRRYLAAFLLIGLAMGPVSAKDIKLGGEQKDKLAPNIVVLPVIAVMIRTDDGGWKHIKIDAWLAGTDADNARKLDGLKHQIIIKADHEIPQRNYETLQSPDLGTKEAKRIIHAAVEAGLGHEWKGEVLIHNMMVY